MGYYCIITNNGQLFNYLFVNISAQQLKHCLCAFVINLKLLGELEIEQN